MSIEIRKTIEVVSEPDVLVCGAGPAGIAAAVSAARFGVRTMVVDTCGFGGGYFTAVSGPAVAGFTDLRTGHPVVGGVLIDLLQRIGTLQGSPLGLPFNASAELHELQDHPDWGIVRADPERCKWATDKLFDEAGVEVLYHTTASDVVMAGDHLQAVVLANKAGLVAVKPRVVVDCTGDGDVAAWAGVPFEIADILQPMTLRFRVINVPATIQMLDKCQSVLEQAHREGRMGVYAGPWATPCDPSELNFCAVRIRANCTSPVELSQAEIQGRRDAWRMFELWKETIPEFKDAYFMASGPVIGPRESRRIVGVYTLTEQDIRERRPQGDVVALGSWRLDRHPHDAAGYHDQEVVAPYDISYRTLLPQKVENLLVAGRCHSATSGALASSRVAGTAMGMGHAAGIAAALAVNGHGTPHEVSIQRLQAELLAQGAILESP